MKDASCQLKPHVAAQSQSLRGSRSRRSRQSWPLAVALLLALSLAPPQALSAVNAGPAEGDPTTSVEGTQAGPHWLFLPLVTRHHHTNLDRRFAIQLFQTSQEQVGEAAVAGGARIRIPLCWSGIERENTLPSGYTWPVTYEEGLVRIAASGMDLILTIDCNPDWAATYSGGPIDKVPISEFVEFVTAAVARYGAPPYNVKLWEFYNEPDNGDEAYAVNSNLGYWGNTPDLYAEMLEAVYHPIKQVDPQAQVLIGGLAYDWWEDQGGPFVEEFLDGVLQAGGGQHFDMLNFHFYPTAFSLNWAAWGPGLIGKITALREKLASYGLVKPVICTEVAVENVNTGTDEIQSRYVALVYTQAMAADLVSLSWFMLVDEPPTGYWKSGLLEYDLDRKPAFYAYQTAVAQLSHTTFLRALSTVEKGTDAMEAYRFLARDGEQLFTVAWTNDELTHPLAFSAKSVLVVDKYGAERWVYDSMDGRVDGVTKVAVGSSPVYLYPQS